MARRYRKMRSINYNWFKGVLADRRMSSTDPAPDFRTLIERSGDAYFRFVFGIGLTDVNPACRSRTPCGCRALTRRR